MNQQAVIDRAQKAFRDVQVGGWFVQRRPQFGFKLINDGNAELRQCLCEAGKIRKRAKQALARQNQKYPKVVYMGDLI
jgi:hypothetical protein